MSLISAHGNPTSTGETHSEVSPVLVEVLWPKTGRETHPMFMLVLRRSCGAASKPNAEGWMWCRRVGLLAILRAKSSASRYLNGYRG